MNPISNKELVLVFLASVGTGILLTPLFGGWIWIALMLSGWAAWLCLDLTDQALAR